MSETLAITRRELERSSERMEMFSASRRATCVAPEPATAAAAGARRAASEPESDLSLSRIGAASSSDDFFLLMRSLMREATSAATAYLRRMTSTRNSGAVGMSISSMILSMKSMFSGRVMMMSRLVRGSGTMATLPRRTPRRASSMIEEAISLAGVARSSSRSRRLEPRMVTPGGSWRRSTPGGPLSRGWATVPDLLFLLLPLSSCILAMRSSMRALTSSALA